MQVVRTVLGDITPQELGFCQCHEHLYIKRGHSAECNAALCIDKPSKTLTELYDYRQNGGVSLVDAQPVGCGRDGEVLRRLSQQSGINVIASTGFHKLCFYPKGHWIFELTESELTALYIAELRVGMSSMCDNDQPKPIATNPKAGQIKVALDRCNIDGDYKKLFSGAAVAARRTGCPIMIHVEQNSDPLQALDFFTSRGVEPHRLLFCHLDRAVADISVHYELCAAGAYLEYDTVGRFKYHSDEQELQLVQNLFEHGYEDRVLMSLDVTAERLLSYGGDIGLSYILNDFTRLLHSAQIPTEQIFVSNPKAAYSVDNGYFA